MGAKKIKVRKKDMQKADEILSLSQRVLEWGRRHTTLILGAVGGLVVVVLVSWAVEVHSDMKERRAQRELAALWRDTEALDPKDEAALNEHLSRLQSVAEKHDGTAAAGGAALTMTRLLFENGRYGEALQWYDRAGKNFSKEGTVDIIMSYGRMMCLESLGRVDEALSGWAALADTVEGGLKREALWHQARLTAIKGDREKARQIYDAALAVKGFYPDDALLRAEKSRL
ncbi:tetratricopeptide repeat protein [Desulfosoma caldarium]|uniref:Tetratricopeptide repeat protein n=1 Tax=Desulfosoma caldarium TaxID=610254 RepID=A0A3N1VLG0_9BACT|nr:tetratricopeptide repeat protein [Desulfosoma caldarium]ROR01801.1 tetratricopeptide repeat protein [Desulfosoma caldarium]